MQTESTVEGINAVRASLVRAGRGGWADPWAVAAELHEALAHLDTLVEAGPAPLEARADLQLLAGELRQAAAAHRQAAEVHDGLLRAVGAALEIASVEGYGANGSAPCQAASGRRIAVEG